MARIDQTNTENINELFDVLTSFKDVDECRAFMCDLCTIQELLLFAQRVQVAKRLLVGDTYETIRNQFPISSATITRINTSLQYGSDGYRSVLSRFICENEVNTSQAAEA